MTGPLIDRLTDDGGETARAASRDVALPSFEDVVRRGERRRRSRRVLALAAAGVVTIGGLAVLEEVAGPADRGRPAHVTRPTTGPTTGPITGPTTGPTTGPAHEPSPSPTTTTDTADASADQVVDSPHARLVRLSVDQADPQSRSASWLLCLNATCRKSRLAVAITDDGFETRRTLLIPDGTSRAAPVGGGAFAVWPEGDDWRLVRPDGEDTRIVVDGPERPLQPGEVLVNELFRVLAVDPRTGSAHRVPGPGHTPVQVLQPGPTWLQELASGANGALLSQSHNGGEGWTTRQLPSTEGMNTMLIPTAVPDQPVLLAGGDGATLFPLDTVLRPQDDGSVDTTHVDSTPRAYVGTCGVLPDGHVVVDVVGWSDDEPGRGGTLVSARPRGLYEVRGTSLVPVPMGAPFDHLDLTREQPAFQAAQPAGSDLLLVASVGPEATGDTYASKDGGHTWEPWRTR